MNRASRLAALMGGGPVTGVIYGLEGPDPGDSATWTYTEGLIRVAAANPLGFAEYRVAGGTIVGVASKHYYVYVDAAGAVGSVNVATTAAQPKIGATGGPPAGAELIAKLVTTADPYISSVEDRRGWANVLLEAFHVPQSFEATEVGDTYITLPFDGRVVAVDGTVINALAATDAGTVTPSLVNENGTARAITDGDLSFAASAAAGVRDLEIPSANTHFQRGDRLKLVSAKSTAGGHVMVSVICEVLGW